MQEVFVRGDKEAFSACASSWREGSTVMRADRYNNKELRLLRDEKFELDSMEN